MRNEPGSVRSSIQDAQRVLIAAAREQARGFRATVEPDPGGSSSANSLSDDLPLGFDSIPPVPDSFAGYRVIRELHRGGQGIVYLATQVSTRRKVAIKVMKEGPFASAVEKARFDREIRTLGQLRHSNIVTIHGTGLSAGHHYFVMDYIPGRPLDEFVAETALSVGELLQVFATIGDAVNAAHLRGVIHRDLKPSNIRIDETGEPHVLDFGLARSALDDVEASAVTATGQFVGSLPWASPEQAEGVPGRLDLRSDVYSIGVMLYQSLTGRFPYDVVGSQRDVMRRIIDREPLRPRTIRADLNDEVETIILKCLEKDPRRRYQTAGELARDLCHYLAGEPIEAKRDSTLYVLRKRLRRHVVAVTIAAAFLVTIIAGLITAAAGWKQAASQRDEAEAARAQAQAVTDFLAQTLGSANPYAGLGPSATIEQVLAAAAQRVEESLEEQPLVRAAVYDSLYGAYDALGLFTEAQRCAQNALELSRRFLPADHPAIAERLRACAHQAVKMGRSIEAESLAREALDMARRRFGPRHLEVADSLYMLGVAVEGQFRAKDAEPIYRQAADQLIEFRGPGHRVTILANRGVASCLQEQGRFDEARPVLEDAVSLARRWLGPDSPDLGNTLATLGEVLHMVGESDAAEAAHLESLSIRRKVFGDEHITIANSLSNLAHLYVDESRFEEAEPLYLRSLDMRRKLYGPRRIEVTYALNGLARLYNKTGRPAQAEPLLRESLTIFDDTQPQHWRRSYAECLLGVTLSAQGQAEEAEALLVEGVAGVRAARGDGDRFAQEVLQFAVDFYEEQGRSDQAAVYARSLNRE